MPSVDTAVVRTARTALQDARRRARADGRVGAAMPQEQAWFAAEPIGYGGCLDTRPWSSINDDRNFTLMYTLGGLLVSADDDMRPYALMEHSPESLEPDEVSRGRLHKVGGATGIAVNALSAFTCGLFRGIGHGSSVWRVVGTASRGGGAVCDASQQQRKKQCARTLYDHPPWGGQPARSIQCERSAWSSTAGGRRVAMHSQVPRFSPRLSAERRSRVARRTQTGTPSKSPPG
jgi:hypothetical protein